MEKVINYDELLFLIKNELVEVMEEDYNYYKDYEFLIDLEQSFLKNNDIKNDERKIFIVLSFGSSEIIFGQSAIPFSLKVMSEQNKLDVAQKLLLGFANKFNLHWNEENTIYQIIEAPVVSSNFNLVHEGFRSILITSGVFLIGKNANPYKLSYFSEEGNKWEEVPVITFQTSFANSLDTQPFFNTQNFTKSRAKFGTLSLSFSLYLTDSELINKVLSIMYRKLDIDTSFKFQIEHSKVFTTKDENAFNNDFKLVSVDTQKTLNEFQILTISFVL
jgi:hypothetical protein